ncbi:NAD(P)-dependent glycerol-3-phosphate dehydrogenase [Sphingobium indicum]|uniref:Glycerol-3-phosphate dehydrogenase [NAD(P)+] n=2 Tax=Sphingobium indicum TaxID=332055 RepID=A0A1L5BRX9_SPHIB|nr:NAD(P)H-dependent glycerol-3-phosphate dehydrogenase [Sphingobium indicum]APL95630.1 glycerol-3-phosphate dehydrogenase [Sphingobium indicum B90A]KEZ00258.1 glycerol-3-phosphate dehydrogenase [Sphingomonas sp. BHC-A]NYI24048.1 glycerol-3-phosphate dehydrogenase (NAD(P)+) [Sphingobium indicum]RYM00185.1 NAD(P)-dependent glycerol-3-phosphate dehydrogenase [Sphingobium indicum]
MKAGIIGAGAWGTALAQTLAADGQHVRLWALEPEVVEAVNNDRQNPLYLPRIPLSPSIEATGDIAAMADRDMLLIVSPAQHLRKVVAQAPAGTPLILCSKGIEAGTGLLMSEVAAQAQPASPIAVLSGPTFAHEVAKGLPTAITLACTDADLAAKIAARIARPAFRPYLSDDVVGAEIGGAVKNVLAIACGVAEGAGLGLNARASLISRGFAEMTRFGLARGARAETLAGLSGLGDLVLTCSSTDSRNFSLGKGLGEGRAARDLLTNRRTVAEGAFTAPVLREAARAARVEMPVVEAVCALLEDAAPLAQVMDALLARPLRAE